MLKGKKILVTGGCGYIGSHTIVDLLDKGADVVCVDNLTNSDARVLDRICAIAGKSVSFVNLDLRDKDKTWDLLDSLPHLDGIIHFAAFKSVGDSVLEPLTYYENNISSLLNLLSWMQHNRSVPFIFSSSCSVYGNTSDLPVTEFTPFAQAESPYAYTKQIGEMIIQDYAKSSSDSQFVILRYFNPAGAHPSGLIGESPVNTPNNLVPVITEVAAGIRPQLKVFGGDYNTKDGTCIRDYIHVMDLASAHTRSLEFLFIHHSWPVCEVFNVGLGKGVSVLEVIDAFKKSTGLPLSYVIAPRRAGDVEAVYADTSKIEPVLNWKALYSLEDIMQSAWLWQTNKSRYYPS
jgi:UDP-glucose 4-epimerase